MTEATAAPCSEPPPRERYRDRICVVTGARGGIGRALVEHFLAEAGRVFGVSRGEPELAHERYTHLGGVDVSEDDAVNRAFQEIRRAEKRVDVFVANAGVITPALAPMLPAISARAMVETNVLGAFFTARAAARLMRKSRSPRIVFVGSMASRLEPAGDALYAATKAATESLTRSLAKELGGAGITVNTLAITAVDGVGMMRQATVPQERIAEIIAGLPIARYATLDDIFHALDFFADERSSYITGQVLHLGGVT